MRYTEKGISVGRIVWWGQLEWTRTTWDADTRVPPADRLSFSGFCLLHTSDVSDRLSACVLDLHRQALIRDAADNRAKRARALFCAVEAGSPYRAPLRGEVGYKRVPRLTLVRAS